MIFINKSGEPIPDVLSSNGLKETQSLCAKYDADNTSFNSGKSKDIFKRSIYAHEEVKDALVRIQNHKCCFCESRVTHISDGDVEHFRPKAEWLRENDDGTKKRVKPGYYFLAYDWSNLMLSCLMCNQRIKGNNFPLLNEAHRSIVTHHYDVAGELSVFINPAMEEPEAHITFYEDSPLGITWRGKKTIEYLNLDRTSLNEARKERYKDLFLYKKILRVVSDPLERHEITEIIKERINETIDMKGEYVAMVKANFKDFL